MMHEWLIDMCALLISESNTTEKGKHIFAQEVTNNWRLYFQVE